MMKLRTPVAALNQLVNTYIMDVDDNEERKTQLTRWLCTCQRQCFLLEVLAHAQGTQDQPVTV